MALFQNDVLTRYRADVSQEMQALDQLIRKNEQLKQAEKDAAAAREKHFDQLVLDLGRAARAEQELAIKAEEARKKAAEEQKGFDVKDIAAGWYLFKDAIGMVGSAFSAAHSAIKGWGEDLRMEAVNAGISIDTLAEAAQGLVDDDSLNQFAARAANGALKLTQGQMEDVARAAVALRERGFDVKTSLDALTEAAVTGKTKGLRPFGLEVEEGGNRFQTARNLMAELNKTIAESHGPVSKAADDVDRLAVAWSNAWDNAKNYGAQAIIAVGQSMSMDDLRQAYNRQNREAIVAAVQSAPAYQRALAIQQQRTFIGGYLKGKNSGDFIEMDEDKVFTKEELKAMAEKAIKFEILEARRALLPLRLAAEARAEALAQIEKSKQMGYGADEFAAARLGIRSTIETNIQAGPSTADLEAAYQTALAGKREFNTRESRYAESAGRRNQSKLEEMFGPIEDFNAYQAAFEMLGGAVTSAMDAWIDGSMSAGQAIKKFLADALKGLASQMAVESLKHVAYALGSLAFGDVRGAGQHAAAAAAFGATAVAAAVASKSLGGGGASTGAGGGGASAGGGSSGGTTTGNDNRDHRTGNGSQSVVVVYADPFAEASARERALTAERTVKRALGGSGGTDS